MPHIERRQLRNVMSAGANRVSNRRFAVAVAAIAMPVIMGAKERGCAGDGAAFSKDPAPDMAGNWSVTYDDMLDIEITLGGAVYNEQIGAQGGTVTIDHNGQPITFDLDCSKPEVVCPSEVWPTEVGIRQNDPNYPHRIWLQVPDQQCSGMLVAPDPAECGAGTNNPDCDQVCDGTVTTTTKEAFGVIDNPGETFWIALGVGLASNGVNCVLAGGSYAEGQLDTTGTSEEGDWEVVSTRGNVVTIFSGGCLWIGDPNMDQQLEALVIGASVRFQSGFTAARK